MASVYPGDIDSFRTIQNVPGEVYDPSKVTRLYAEDVQALDDAIIAVEETLGENPQGSYDTVADRLDDLSPGPAVSLGISWFIQTDTVLDTYIYYIVSDVFEIASGIVFDIPTTSALVYVD